MKSFDEFITYKELLLKDLCSRLNTKLVQNKFDITTLKPFDKVLARDCDQDKWHIDFFEGYNEKRNEYQCMTFTKNQCIPYEGNEYLRGTTNGCDDFYKTW